MHSDFREANDEEEHKKALKHYDLSKGVNQRVTNNRELTREIADVVGETLKNFQKQIIESQKAVVAALKVQDDKLEQVSLNRYQPSDRVSREGRHISPRRDASSSYRRPSPGRDRRYDASPRRGDNLQGTRSSFNSNYYDRQTPSPRAHDSYNQGYRSVVDRPPTPQVANAGQLQAQNAHDVFDSRRYLEKFGRPPRPCGHCGSGHWEKHCPFNLKA